MPRQKNRKTLPLRKKLRAKERTFNHCAYCGFQDSATTVDHIKSWKNCSSEERNNNKNLIGCCTVCNNAKGHMSLNKFRKILLAPDKWGKAWSLKTQYRLAARYGNFQGEFFYKSYKLAQLNLYKNLYLSASKELRKMVLQQDHKTTCSNSVPTLLHFSKTLNQKF